MKTQFMKKRFLTLMLASIASIGMWAESGICGPNLTWNLTDGVLTISGTGNMTNYSSASNVPWYLMRNSITSIIIENGATSVSANAFSGCTNATAATIPNSITSIGDYAFYGCSGLTSITIPGSVTSLGYAFGHCTGLDTIRWGIINYPDFGSLSDAMFSDIQDSITTFIFEDGVQHVPAYLCGGMHNLTTVIIPNSVTSIGTAVFNDCYRLMSVSVPSNVTSIGQYAFFNVFNVAYEGEATGSPWGAKHMNLIIDGYFCYSDSTKTNIAACLPSAADSVVIPEGVISTEIGAFTGCSAITSITIPSTMVHIGANYAVPAFKGCSGLTSVIWNAKNHVNPTISNEAPFYSIRKKITSFIFGDSVRYVPGNICLGMSSLSSIELTNNIDSIGDWAFSGCTGLTSIVLPNSITKIGQSAFQNCSGLTSVTLSESLTSIPREAFEDCSGLNSINIPNGIRSVGSFSFSDCTSLTSINLPDSVTYIGSHAFSRCTGLTSFTIPQGVTQIDNSPFLNCNNLSSLTWNAVNYTYFNLTTPLSDLRKSLKTVVIGDCVQYIYRSVFSSLDSLTTVIWNAKNCNDFSDSYNSPFNNVKNKITTFTFGDSVQHIPAYLCGGMTSLNSVSIPSSVTSIGGGVFAGCTGLTSFVLPDNVISVGKSAFYNTSLTEPVYNTHVFAYLPMTYSGEYAIPEGVETIAAGAFTNCSSLWSVSFPKSIQTLSEQIFENCYILTSILWNAKNCDDFDGPYVAPFSRNTNSIMTFTFGDSVEHIPAYLCYQLQNVHSIILPESLRSIGHDAFGECTGLDTITIPQSVDSIGNYAFYGHNFSRVTTLNETPPALGRSAWWSETVDSTLLVVPCYRLSDYATSLWGRQFFTKLQENYPYTIDIASADVSQGTVSILERSCDSVHIVATPTTGYALASWSDGSVNAERYISHTQDTSLVAFFERQTFTITFLDWDGDTVQSGLVYYDSIPAIPAAPESRRTPQYTYYFTGWQPYIVPAHENAIYVATYDSIVNRYVVAFLNEDRSLLQVETLDYGVMPEYRGETPVKPNEGEYFFVFTGWEPEVVPVVGDATYVATFESHGMGFDNVADEQKPVKVMVDGKMYILLPNGTRYDATGKKVE